MRVSSEIVFFFTVETKSFVFGFHSQLIYVNLYIQLISNNSNTLSKSNMFNISRLAIIPLSADFTKWSNTLKQFVGN